MKNKWWKDPKRKEEVVRKANLTKGVKKAKQSKKESVKFFENHLMENPIYYDNYIAFKKRVIEKDGGRCTECSAYPCAETPNIKFLMFHRDYTRPELFFINDLETESDVLGSSAVWDIEFFITLCGKCASNRSIKRRETRLIDLGGYKVRVSLAEYKKRRDKLKLSTPIIPPYVP